MNKKEYLSKGAIVKKKFLSKKLVSDIISDIHMVFRTRFEYAGFNYKKTPNGEIQDKDLINFFTKNRDAYIGCMTAIQNLPIIYNIGLSSKIIMELHKIGLKFPTYIQKPIIMLNSERTATKIGNWKVPSHQDWRSMQGSLNLAVIWIALKDVPLELGPVEVIPGSHHRGLLPAEEDDWFMHVKEDVIREEDFISVPLNAGDAVIFSGFLVHRSGINKSDNIRYSLQFRYNDLLETTYIKRNFPNPFSSTPVKEIITKKFPSNADMKKIFEFK